jgi:hypothetical protein
VLPSSYLPFGITGFTPAEPIPPARRLDLAHDSKLQKVKVKVLMKVKVKVLMTSI